MVTIEYTFWGILHGGKNNMLMTRTGRHYPNPVWAKWRDAIVADMKQKLKPVIPVKSTLKMGVDYWRGDLRRRDLTAMIDAIYHCLERAGVIEDDSKIIEIDWRDMGLDRANPRTMIWLNEIKKGA